MNKKELVDNVAKKSGLSKKDAEKAVDAFMSSVEDALVNDEKIQLIGFGTFENKERAARKGRNPQTGEELHIPAAKIPTFRPGKALKESLN